MEIHTSKLFPFIARRPATLQEFPQNLLAVFIGAEPNTDWLSGVVQRDERGFILTGSDLIRDGKK